LKAAGVRPARSEVDCRPTKVHLKKKAPISGAFFLCRRQINIPSSREFV